MNGLRSGTPKMWKLLVGCARLSICSLPRPPNLPNEFSIIFFFSSSISTIFIVIRKILFSFLCFCLLKKKTMGRLHLASTLSIHNSVAPKVLEERKKVSFESLLLACVTNPFIERSFYFKIDHRICVR